jgi:hypothetical protein
MVHLEALAATQSHTNCKDNCDANVTNITKVSGGICTSSQCDNAGIYTNTWTVKSGNISDKFIQVIIIQDTTALFGLL